MKFFDSKINTILMTIYMFLICFSFVFVFITDRGLILILVSAALLPLLLIASGFVLACIGRMKPVTAQAASGRGLKTVFAVSSILTFLVLMLFFLAYSPGSFQGDCISQVGQALSGRYDNWHPVWQTLLFYTLPLKLTGGKMWSMTFFQMIWFSLTMGYLVMTVYEYSGRWWAAGFWGYIMLNPYTGQMLLYPWKDNAFSMAGALAFAMTARICITGAQWADNTFRCVILGILLANCTIFRHNAVALTAVLLLALFFMVKRVRWLQIAISFLVFMIIVEGPVYNLLDVKRTPQSVTQSVGLPMAVIGNAVKETPELLDEDILEFAYEIAPREVWESDYETGNFGVMKYYSEVDLQPIEDMGTAGVFKMAFRCMAASPKASMKAVFALMDIVYGIDLKDEGYIGSQIVENDYGIEYRGNERLADILMLYYKIVRLHGFNFVRQFAFAILVLAAFVLGRYDLRSLREWKHLFPILSIFAYSFGTMLLLTSADSRFFYIDYLLCPLAVMIACSHNRILQKDDISPQK